MMPRRLPRKVDNNDGMVLEESSPRRIQRVRAPRAIRRPARRTRQLTEEELQKLMPSEFNSEARRVTRERDAITGGDLDDIMFLKEDIL